MPFIRYVTYRWVLEIARERESREINEKVERDRDSIISKIINIFCLTLEK